MGQRRFPRIDPIPSGSRRLFLRRGRLRDGRLGQSQRRFRPRSRRNGEPRTGLNRVVNRRIDAGRPELLGLGGRRRPNLRRRRLFNRKGQCIQIFEKKFNSKSLSL